MEINAEDFISIKGIKASGNQLTPYKVNQVNALEPLPYEPPEVKPAIEIEVVDEEEVLGQSSSENDDQHDAEFSSLLPLAQSFTRPWQAPLAVHD